MNESKIKSYLGFSIKSGECIFGQDMLKNEKKRIYLIILCSSASTNLCDLADRLSTKHKCQCYKTENLENLTHKQNCKIIGLTNANLAEAILKNI